MAITWQRARATLYEQEQILRAGFSLSPVIPTHYVCRISTTLPAEDGSGITEYSGNNYSPVTIPAWSANVDSNTFTDPDLPTNEQGMEMEYAQPAANIVFPDPSAAWWADGTTVYPYLTDQDGNFRWWWSATPATAPYPGHPLQFNVFDGDGNPATAIAVGIQSLGNLLVHSALARKVARGALGKLTKTDSSYTMPSLYAAIGNHASSPKEPNDPGLCYWCGHFRFRTTSGDPSYPDGSVVPDSPFQSIGSGYIKDSGYTRQGVTMTYGGLDTDGRPYVKNSSAISFTLGSNTETSHVSGDSLPSIFGNRQLQWLKYFYFDPTLVPPLQPTYFCLRGSSSGGTGGAAPGGFAESGGDIWAYLYPDTYDVIATRDLVWVFWPFTPYEIAGDDELSRDNTGTLPDYSAHGYLFELQTDGNFHNATWGSISPGALGVAQARFYYYPNLFSATWAGAADVEYEDLNNTGFGAPLDAYYPSDTIGFDAGAIRFRVMT